MMKKSYRVLGIMILAALIEACGTTAPVNARPPHWASVIKADANLHKVDDNLYRSEQPIKDDIASIHQQNIKTIINLRYFDRDDNDSVFAGQDMTLINEPLLTWRVRPSDIARVLYQIEVAQAHGAVLVHCYHGSDRTGIVVAMYRIIYQQWTIEEARQEMKHGDFGHHKIWKNLDNLLNEVAIAQVKAEIDRLKSAKSKAS